MSREPVISCPRAWVGWKYSCGFNMHAARLKYVSIMGLIVSLLCRLSFICASGLWYLVGTSNEVRIKIDIGNFNRNNGMLGRLGISR